MQLPITHCQSRAHGCGTLPLLEQLTSTVGGRYQSRKPDIVMLLLEIKLSGNQARFSHVQGIFLIFPLNTDTNNWGEIHFQNREKPYDIR